MSFTPALYSDQEIAHESAKILMETQSILFNAEEPFQYTSGRVGPVYIDCRRLISFPRARGALMNFAVSKIIKECGYEALTHIAGGETAGIPYAAWIAERLELPMLYVRKKAKGFGRMAQIEGHMEENANVILVEDLQTDGGSKKLFINALREAGANVNHTFVVFHYGIFAASEENMKALDVQLHSLTNWWDVLETAKSLSYFDEKTLQSVENFLHNPVQWSVDHGGKGEE